MGKISPGTHEVPLALGVDIGASAEVIILGGNVAAAGDQLFAPLRMEVAERTSPMLGREVPIVQQSTIGFGSVAGAAALVFLHQQLLKI